MSITSHSLDLDLASEAFLQDHRVDGVAILPTVMALDALVSAAFAGRTGRAAGGSLQINGLHVGPPVRFEEAILQRLRVSTSDSGPDTLHCQLRGEGGTLHYAATIRLLGRSAARAAAGTAPTRETGPLPLTSTSIYPPFFHGPQLQVVGAARVDTEGVVARLSSSVAPLRWSWRPAVSAATLLELLLQACGLWDAARSGRLTTPARVDQILLPAGGLGVAPVGAEARIRPRAMTGPTVFDGAVVDGDENVLLEVRGHATVPLEPNAGSDPPDFRAMRAALGLPPAEALQT